MTTKKSLQKSCKLFSLNAHTAGGAECRQYRRCYRGDKLNNKLCSLSLGHSSFYLLIFLPFGKRVGDCAPKRLIAVVWQTTARLAAGWGIATAVAIVAILVLILRILYVA